MQTRPVGPARESGEKHTIHAVRPEDPGSPRESGEKHTIQAARLENPEKNIQSKPSGPKNPEIRRKTYNSNGFAWLALRCRQPTQRPCGGNQRQIGCSDLQRQNGGVVVITGGFHLRIVWTLEGLRQDATLARVRPATELHVRQPAVCAYRWRPALTFWILLVVTADLRNYYHSCAAPRRLRRFLLGYERLTKG